MDLPVVCREQIQSLEEALQGITVEYRYFLDGGNGRFPAYMSAEAIYYCDKNAVYGKLSGKPFVFGPWVLRVVHDEEYMCIVTRRYRPDLRAWYWLKRRIDSFISKSILTWRIWTNRY